MIYIIYIIERCFIFVSISSSLTLVGSSGFVVGVSFNCLCSIVDDQFLLKVQGLGGFYFGIFV